MKIREVRDALRGHDPERLRTLAAELYKALPKKVREAKGIDDLVADPEGWIAARRRRRQEAAPAMAIELLEYDVEQFIGDAANKLYCAPNRIISARERPKWRFTVMRLVKEINRAARWEEDAPLAADLMERLYLLLCRDCHESLFSTDDPFQAVRIGQPDFLRNVMGLWAACETPRRLVERGFSLLTEPTFDCMPTNPDLIEALLDSLPTAPLKEIALEVCRDRRASPGARSRPGGRGSTSRERRRETRNVQAEFGLRCCLRLLEPERGIAFFREHYRAGSGAGERDEEIELYVLLRTLAEKDLDDLWVREYEAATLAGVRPRDRLAEQYRHRTG